MTPAVPGNNGHETRPICIDAKANRAEENSSQAVANQNHNTTLITCCNQRTALFLATAILIIAGVTFGLGFGLSSRSNHDASTTVPSTPSASSLTPTPATTPAFEASPIKQVTSPSSSTSATNSTRLPPPTTSSLTPSRTNQSPGIMLSTSTPTASSTILPPPSPSPKADGVHLVGYRNGTIKGNGFAYYRSAQQGNQGALPDDFTVANVHINGQWEGFNTTGYFADTAVTFWASIDQTTSSVNEAVGIAGNGHHSFLVYKDDGGFLYTKDGIDFYSRFYCHDIVGKGEIINEKNLGSKNLEGPSKQRRRQRKQSWVDLPRLGSPDLL